MVIDRDMAIHARGLSKEFGRHVVLRAVDFHATVGESIGLAGANGAGKTTLLRCLALAMRPTAGEVYWFGRPAARAPVMRRMIGMVAHEHCLYSHLTLRENLMFAARMCGVRHPARRADAWLECTGLAGRATCRPGQISRGMQQRLAVARALVHDPQILFLDEPFAGLDAEGTEWLMALLLDLRQRGRTICFASHDEARTRRLADRALVLRSGRLHPLPADLDASAREVALGTRAA